MKNSNHDLDLNDSVIGLYGVGGCARELMPLVVEKVADSGANSALVRLVFIDDNKHCERMNGYEVMSLDDYLALGCSSHYFNIGVGDSRLRKTLAEKCMSRGALPISLQSSHMINYDVNTIDKGSVLCGNVMLTTNISIGKFFQANYYSYVAHDCAIGDYVTFAPRVSCNGNVQIGNCAYIGAGAVLKQGCPDKPLVIGEGAVVGMGAVVTKDVAAFTTVVGNPARPFKRLPFDQCGNA